MSRPSAIAVITARGGSKGLPGKNIINLGGKPLLAWTIQAALEADAIDTVVVTTDYENIREVALEYGAEAPFLRPAELSGDKAHTPDAVEHAVAYFEKELGRPHDLVVTLQPTSPFRNGKHIDEAVSAFLADPTLDSLISVKKQDYPPWWMFVLDGNRLKPAFEFKEGVNVFNLERQEFPAVYRPNGATYVCARDFLKNNGAIVNPANNGYYVMSMEDSVDIDNLADLMEAELVLKNRIEQEQAEEGRQGMS